MDCSKLTAAQRKKVESHGNEVVNIEFTLRTPLHEPCVEADFVHSILGRILTEAENGSDEEIGRVEASLVQFSEAVDSGISPDRLGDGIDGNISEYWECLFDPNDGRLKQEVLDDHEFLGCDLLIIDRIEVVPKFRGRGVARSAIERTIQIFGEGCGLVVCKPWPLQFAPGVARDQKLPRGLNVMGIGREEAISKLRKYCSQLGFWPLGNTGIYIRSTAVGDEFEHRKLSANREARSGGGRVC